MNAAIANPFSPLNPPSPPRYCTRGDPPGPLVPLIVTVATVPALPTCDAFRVHDAVRTFHRVSSTAPTYSGWSNVTVAICASPSIVADTGTAGTLGCACPGKEDLFGPSPVGPD